MAELDESRGAHLEEDKNTAELPQIPQDSVHTENDFSLTGKSLQRTIAIIKPDAMQAGRKNDIVSKVKEAGFIILTERDMQLSLQQARLFYAEHENNPFYDGLTQWMSSEHVYAMVLEKQNAVQEWKAMMGPTNPTIARETDPSSLRALYGTDETRNATHGSDSESSAAREISIVFENELPNQEEDVTLDNITKENAESNAFSETDDVANPTIITENPSSADSVDTSDICQENEGDIDDSQATLSDKDGVGNKPDIEQAISEEKITEPVEASIESTDVPGVTDATKTDISSDVMLDEVKQAGNDLDNKACETIQVVKAADSTGTKKTTEKNIKSKASSNVPVNKNKAIPKKAGSETGRGPAKLNATISGTSGRSGAVSQMPRIAKRVSEKSTESADNTKKTTNTSTRQPISRLVAPSTASPKKSAGTKEPPKLVKTSNSSTAAPGQPASPSKKDPIPASRTGLKKPANIRSPAAAATATTVTGPRTVTTATTNATTTTRKSAVTTPKTSTTASSVKTGSSMTQKRVLKPKMSGTEARNSLTSGAAKKQPIRKPVSSQESQDIEKNEEDNKSSEESKRETEQVEQPRKEQEASQDAEQAAELGGRSATPEITKIAVQDVEETVADAEVATVTSLQIKEASQGKENLTKLASGGSAFSASLNPSRPHTPEVAQLRNKFETLGSNEPSRSSSSSIRIQSKSPNHIKDLINRFAG